MDGIVKSMLLLILMGGMVIFLLMQVLGYGVPLPDSVGVSQAASLPEDEAPSTEQGKLARRSQRLDLREAQLDERAAQLEECATALAETEKQQAGEAARLAGLADKIAQDQADLDAQKKQLVADRKAFEQEQAQVEGLRKAVVEEAARQAIRSGELEAQEQELAGLEQRLYVIAFVLCATSIVYHLAILRLLWVRGYLARSLQK